MRARVLLVLSCLLPAVAASKPPPPETPPADLKEKGLVIDSPAEGATVKGRWTTVSGWVDPKVVVFVAVSGAPVDGFYLPTGHMGIPMVFSVQSRNGRFIAPRVPVQDGETKLVLLPFLQGGGGIAQAITRTV